MRDDKTDYKHTKYESNLVPDVVWPPGRETAVRHALDGLVSMGNEFGSLRNLTLCMIYMHAGEKSWTEITSDRNHPAYTIEQLQNTANGLELPLPNLHHLDAGTLSDLALEIKKLVEKSGSGNAFQLALEMFDRGQGVYYTPRSIVSLMVDSIRADPNSTIYDPVCGAGELLVAAARSLDTRDTAASPKFRSTALTEELKSIVRMNLEINNVRAEIDVSPTPFDRNAAHPKYPYILANPPFNMKYPNWSSEQSWRYGNPPRHNGNYAWLQRIVENLTKDGRAAVVMPNNTLHSGGLEQKIRAAMIEDGCIEAIIALPGKLFRKTRVAVSIWLLKPPGSALDDILLIDATSSGRKVERTQRALEDSELDDILRIVADRRAGKSIDENASAKSVSLEEIRRSEYNLSPAVHLTPISPRVDGSRFELSLQRSAEQLRNAVLGASRKDLIVAELMHGLNEIKLSARGSWTNVALGDISEITPGAPTSDHPNGGTPVVKPKNISSGRIHGPTDYVDYKQAERRSDYRIRSDDILCSRTGTIGKIALVTADQDGWVFGTGLIRIRPTAIVDPLYLTLYLINPHIQDWFARNASGAAIQSINAKTLTTLPIQLPPLSDQKAIGRALAKFDEMIAAHDQVLRETVELRDTLLPILFSGELDTIRLDSTEDRF
ncbi:type I restriction-modification system subunit M/S [Nocardia panacis]|nr:type I restriction-modification system subunit M/S [Nocardia panacis]